MAIAYNSNYDLTIPFSDVSVPIALEAGVARSWTVPGNDTTGYSVKFSYNATSNIFIRKNSAAAVPTAGAPAVVPYQEFRPGDDGSQRRVVGGDVLYFITPDTTAFCGLSIRQLQD